MNIGIIIFAVMFIYILICVVLYFTKSHVNRYEVRTGSLSISNVYDGIILRQEEIVSANSSGYINYFAREGEHVAVGDMVYSLDQTGKMADVLSDQSTEILLSGNDLYEIKSDFISYAHNYRDERFDLTYDFSYDMQGTIAKLSNYNLLNNLQVAGGYSGSVDFKYASRPGIVIYNVDGYEHKTPSMITASEIINFDETSKTQFVNNTLIGSNDAVYKEITSEKWSIIIPVEEERIATLQGVDYVQVKFSKNQYKSWGKVNILGKDGDYTMVELQFTNSMITFAKDRLINIEIILNNDSGLKIPNSSIIEKEFYLIPKEFAVTDEKGNVKYFMKESYDEEGNIKTVKHEVSVYSETDTDYYVDTTSLRVGDNIIKPDSSDRYPISKTGTLIGVYNINKGFADFKEITVLYSNEEYSIVKSNTNYGLTEYDYIVLDAKTINEDDFINE